MATTGPHFAELLLAMKLRGPRDLLRSRSGFSDDIQQANAVFHNARIPRPRKITAYRNWPRTEQPCVFDRSAVGKRQVFICLLDEREILLMRRGDHRKVTVGVWFKDESQSGEYCPKRVILEIYDAMQSASGTGKPYRTRLDPPPVGPRVTHPPRTEA